MPSDEALDNFQSNTLDQHLRHIRRLIVKDAYKQGAVEIPTQGDGSPRVTTSTR